MKLIAPFLVRFDSLLKNPREFFSKIAFPRSCNVLISFVGITHRSVEDFEKMTSNSCNWWIKEVNMPMDQQEVWVKKQYEGCNYCGVWIQVHRRQQEAPSPLQFLPPARLRIFIHLPSGLLEINNIIILLTAGCKGSFPVS